MKKYCAVILAALFLFEGCSMMGNKQQQGAPGVQAKAAAGKAAAGKPVAPGIYTYLTEGALLNENTVLWTGKIRIGDGRQTSKAAVSYFPAGADKLGRTLISDVSAVYDPAW